MIAVINYGAGNTRSVANALDLIGQETRLTSSPDELKAARGIVFPGVGAFADCMARIRELGLIEPLNRLVLNEKKPFLGICLGMQCLGTEGLEHGRHEGLGWIKGRVVPLAPEDRKFRIPHMGWNDLTYDDRSPLFQDMNDSPVFYFVHGYHLQVDPEDADCVVGTCWHGQTVTAAVQKDNIFGTQFHPEKSQENGIKLLENFIKTI